MFALLGVELGDEVRLPDGRLTTVRAVERELSHPVGTMAGFVLAGEVGPGAALLGMPPSPDGAVTLYAPLDSVPAHARSAREVVAGVVAYWAPHLPGLSGAMGELGYKVCVVRGSVDPMVLVWRGRELVVFIRSAVADPGLLRVRHLQRDPSRTERHVDRVAAVVRPTEDIPAADPSFADVRELYRSFTAR